MSDKYKTARDMLIAAANGTDPELARRAKRALAILDGNEDGPTKDEQTERHALAVACPGLVRACPQALEASFPIGTFRTVARQWIAADSETRTRIEHAILSEAAARSLTPDQREALDRAFSEGEPKLGVRATPHSLELGC